MPERYTMQINIVKINDFGENIEEPVWSWTCPFATTNLEDCNADMEHFSERIADGFADAWEADKEGKTITYCDPTEEEQYRHEQAEIDAAEDVTREIFLSTYNLKDYPF